VFSDTQIAARNVLHVPCEGDGPMSCKVTCDGKAQNTVPDARGVEVT
jgi:hypothetical protein